MLVLRRKKDERIKIGDAIEIVVCRIERNAVQIGIVAPKTHAISRAEARDDNRREDPGHSE